MREMFSRMARHEAPILNADRWLRHENLRIFLGTRQAARLANRSLRAEKKANHRALWWI